jgi:hypothetical protein
MILKVRIRPQKIESHYKYDIPSKLGLNPTYSRYGNHFTKLISKNEDDIYVINYEKHRKKTRQKKVTKNGKKVTKSTVIRNSHWIGYVYCIPKFWLMTENKIVIQNKRNFVFKNK